MILKRVSQVFFLLLILSLRVSGGEPLAPETENKDFVPQAAGMEELTVSGVVKKVGVLKEGCCKSPVLCLCIIPESGGGEIQVRLGPDYIFRKFKVRFQPGDHLEVTCLKKPAKTEPFLHALRIKSCRWTMILRDEDGEPYWRQGVRKVRFERNPANNCKIGNRKI